MQILCYSLYGGSDSSHALAVVMRLHIVFHLNMQISQENFFNGLASSIHPFFFLAGPIAGNVYGKEFKSNHKIPSCAIISYTDCKDRTRWLRWTIQKKGCVSDDVFIFREMTARKGFVGRI